jgi:hypothetical protein
LLPALRASQRWIFFEMDFRAASRVRKRPTKSGASRESTLPAMSRPARRKRDQNERTRRLLRARENVSHYL